jgi:hypothetical protein
VGSTQSVPRYRDQSEAARLATIATWRGDCLLHGVQSSETQPHRGPPAPLIGIISAVRSTADMLAWW